jgi:hypothetical protein
LLRVSVEAAPGDVQSYAFRQPFRIGRADDCGLPVKNEYVSRNHAEVVFENGQWCVRDLNSGNGLFVDGRRTQMVLVGHSATFRLGIAGPIVSMSVAPPPLPPQAPAVPGVAPAEDVLASYIDHYFGAGSDDKPAGQHTMLVRRAFTQVQKKQKRKYGWIIGALALLLVCIGAYSFYLHQQASRRKEMAESLFYAMKSLDLDIANVRQLVTDSNSQQGIDEIRKYQDRRKEMEKSYDQFLTTLNIYERKMTPEERLLLRITRIFGECELDMPRDFVAEVEKYIGKWKQSGRLAKDLRAARDNNYIAPIARELLAAGLPPQFFYLALQESDFDPYISGPVTRKGIAKGMWQFIPETAVRYNLKIGPLADLRRPDPGDDRHHWDRETKAAVRYMRDLYGSDAQASGLLVMACYNWGEDYVLPLVRKLPANPKDRNFWRLLSTYGDKLPQETHDYVFYIVSAAVIGENPRLFGFDFDNPLAQLESQ